MLFQHRLISGLLKMQAYLQVTSSGTTTYANPPDSVCVLVAQFVKSVQPDHPMRDKAVVWELPHPELLGVIATKTDEEQWKPWDGLDLPTDILSYLNQQFSRSARDYPA